MAKKTYLIALVILLSSFTMLQAQYEVIDAFPNLSFRKPVLLTYSPDGTDRIFVVEQDGKILVFPNDPEVESSQVQTFLDITEKFPGGVEPYGEYGLIGLAFHPDYAENGEFFVNYVTTEDEIKTHINKFNVSESDPNVADAASETVLLEIDQILKNHNAGMLTFGNDGYLYASLGDGGWEYPEGEPDPGATAQDLTNLLGSLLRIDVDGSTEGLEYSIPPDNPFAGNDQGYREEIYAYGFRNPWRFSIDNETGKIWLADVGFASWEEINIVEPGKNYGWSQVEGMDCRPGVDCDTSADYEFPIYVYQNGPDGCSITGGYVYRGANRPELFGKYIFGDWCDGKIWALEDSGDSITSTLLTDKNFRISSFGEDENHELYIVSLDFAVPTKIYKFKSAVTSVEEPGQIKSYSLSQNFPNPFNPETIIEYSIPTEQIVSIKLYDVLGRQVAELVNENKQAGRYSVKFAADGLSSGVYFYKISAGDFYETRKMVLAK